MKQVMTRQTINALRRAGESNRAERELKGFAKVSLEPGETKAVSISVPVDSLAYYDVASSSWKLEPLEHAVHIGPSSRDLPLSTTLRVRGESP